MNVQSMSINGRKISYRRIGTGKRKILFFHGFPGSSVQIEPFLDHLLEFDLEVVCVDRPGYHGSVSNNESQFKQTTEVCEHIINSLGWISVELIAVSGGTPFLFSFLEKFPERISRVSVVCGLGPISSPGYQNFMTWKAKLALKILPRIPDQIFAKIFSKNNGKKIIFNLRLLLFFYNPLVRI